VKVSKWGNSLAVRLPSAVVEALGLKEGGQIEVTIVGPRQFEIRRDRDLWSAIERLRKLRRPFLPISHSTGLRPVSAKPLPLPS
jgi:antitoxin MazE